MRRNKIKFSLLRHPWVSSLEGLFESNLSCPSTQKQSDSLGRRGSAGRKKSEVSTQFLLQQIPTNTVSSQISIASQLTPLKYSPSAGLLNVTRSTVLLSSIISLHYSRLSTLACILALNSPHRKPQLLPLNIYITTEWFYPRQLRPFLSLQSLKSSNAHHWSQDNITI